MLKRILQVIGIILALWAGILWSERLGTQTYARLRSQANDATTEQRALVAAKVKAENDPYILVKLGRRLLAGNPEFAALAFARATELLPSYRDGWYLLGYAELKAGALEPARAALRQSHAIDPKHQPTNELLDKLGEKAAANK